MRRVRVALVGTGEPGDPFRCELPTYTTVMRDTAQGFAVVDIPDECYPPAPKGKGETVHKDDKLGDVIIAVHPDHARDARKFFDEMYREHAGEFQLDVT